MVTAFLRMIIGPTIADRAVALDAMTLVTISLIAFLTLLLQRKVYLDVAIVYALISFLGVIAVARFLDKGL
ncbi:MAG: cation:proton antiporter [Candidatus Cloacimonetes bacterium]|nr:cation:proton antiporter [Candidatus Cloacimonadota bacterium]